MHQHQAMFGGDLAEITRAGGVNLPGGSTAFGCFGAVDVGVSGGVQDDINLRPVIIPDGFPIGHVETVAVNGDRIRVLGLQGFTKLTVGAHNQYS